MSNCNYSEHAKIQRKEIQKQIEELQQKLEELENSKSPVEIAFKDNYGVYPDELKSNDDFNCWVSFKRGYIAAKKERAEEPKSQTLYKMLNDKEYRHQCDDICDIVENWLYDNSTTVEEDHHIVTLKLKKGTLRESND